MNIARVLLSMLLVSAGLAAQTEFLKPEGVAAANGYTHVVTTGPGKLIYLSGQVALNPKGELVGKDDLPAQTEQVFQNMKAALAAAGATFSDVIKINWYVKDLKPEALPAVRRIRDKYVNT